MPIEIDENSNSLLEFVVASTVIDLSNDKDEYVKPQENDFAYIRDIQFGNSFMAKIVKIENNEISFHWHNGSNTKKKLFKDQFHLWKK